MNKLILLVPIVVIIAISVFILSSSEYPKRTELPLVYENDFTFYDIADIETNLMIHDIFMSTPVPITDHTIEQYCTFFDDENTQHSVEYCTTTALVDSEGVSFGNINMGGTTDGPIMALAIIDASPFLDSRDNEVEIVFQTLIDILVCDCWEKQQPGGFESVNLWLDEAKKAYSESSQTTLKSKITGLDNKKLILEITQIEESYLWTLVVLK